MTEEELSEEDLQLYYVEMGSVASGFFKGICALEEMGTDIIPTYRLMMSVLQDVRERYRLKLGLNEYD